MHTQAALEKADILVVDDVVDNLRLVADILTMTGYKIRAALNGPCAIRAAQLIPPDLILLDIVMPGMNGIEVCEHLKADPRTCSVPVIFITTSDEAEDLRDAYAVGGVDYILKPFRIQELLKCVKCHLTGGKPLHAPLMRQWEPLYDSEP